MPENLNGMTPELHDLCETLFDITLVAGDLIHKNALRDVDSRALFGSCLGLAVEFEDKYGSQFGDIDYLSTVDEYAYRELMAEYGKES